MAHVEQEEHQSDGLVSLTPLPRIEIITNQESNSEEYLAPRNKVDIVHNNLLN
ncbi:hypothetical protein BGZ80_003435, partial [Entomortierella chlamydospora]